MPKTETTYFDEKIDCWILDSVRSGITNFDDLLTSLPGVYPTIVKDSIERLVSRRILSASLINTPRYDHLEKIPLSSKFVSHIPHPLDFDWRFSRPTSQKLLRYLNLLTKEHDKIALLGTPSFLGVGLAKFRRKLLFFDKNIESQPNIHPNLSCYKCDILRDTLPQIEVETVLADPPWYPKYMHGFMWSASKITKIGGYVLFCLPPEGTRPNVENEVSECVAYAKKIGFNLLRYNKGVLSYSTPLFENNALRANGIMDIRKDWRRGDLAIFYRVKKTNVARPTTLPDEEWTEIRIVDIRIRVRSSNSIGFQDPHLLSLIPNNILPSVSSRDERRKLADVWTSGNRIFACNGTNILIQILLAKSLNLSPINSVSTFLKRNLTMKEITLVSSASQQIDELVNCEQKEIDYYHYSN